MTGPLISGMVARLVESSGSGIMAGQAGKIIVTYLYTFHNDIMRYLNMDHGLQNPLPAIGDSDLIFITENSVDTILAAQQAPSNRACVTTNGSARERRAAGPSTS